MQTGNKATERKKAKIFPEEYHREELENRLLYEESAFSADLRGEDRPIDINLNGGSSHKKFNTHQSSNVNFKQLEIEL